MTKGSNRKWCIQLKNGRTNNDQERSGRTSIVIDDLVAKVDERIRENHHLAITELPITFPQVSHKLGNHTFFARWCQKCLQITMKNNNGGSCDVFGGLPTGANRNRGRNLEFSPKTKEMSANFVGKEDHGNSTLGQACVLIDFLECGATINSQWYCQILQNLRRAVKNKLRGKLSDYRREIPLGSEISESRIISDEVITAEKFLYAAKLVKVALHQLIYFQLNDLMRFWVWMAERGLVLSCNNKTPDVNRPYQIAVHYGHFLSFFESSHPLPHFAVTHRIRAVHFTYLSMNIQCWNVPCCKKPDNWSNFTYSTMISRISFGTQGMLGTGHLSTCHSNSYRRMDQFKGVLNTCSEKQMLQFEPHWRVAVVGGRGFVPRGVI
ncbi:hypothetical protein J6590_015734 [Homalodisca vitripennis]|nr:hypothetical protein J6590_015734 [Homalodisca vitripennis]